MAANTGEREPEFHSCHYLTLKSSFNKFITIIIHTKKQESPSTGKKKKAIKINCPWESPQIGLTRQRLPTSYCSVSKEPKEVI